MTGSAAAKPLEVTPSDIDWYLKMFPDDGEKIEQMKADGKIVVNRSVAHENNCNI